MSSEQPHQRTTRGVHQAELLGHGVTQVSSHLEPGLLDAQ
jgi:hypothetical protein